MPKLHTIVIPRWASLGLRAFELVASTVSILEPAKLHRLPITGCCRNRWILSLSFCPEQNLASGGLHLHRSLGHCFHHPKHPLACSIYGSENPLGCGLCHVFWLVACFCGGCQGDQLWIILYHEPG
jgi:hypothetical protein